MNKIKPCPDCNNQNIMVTKVNYKYFIKCPKCNRTIPPHLSEKSAIQNWNRLTPTAIKCICLTCKWYKEEICRSPDSDSNGYKMKPYEFCFDWEDKDE